MKNNFNKIEDLLQTGKTINLSVSERDEMKSTLISYAEFHGVKTESTKSPFAMSSLWVRSVASVSLALALFIGTGHTSANSLPGELLYSVKTNVIEELTAATKLTPLSQLEYYHERYETRLFEVQALSQNGTIASSALNDSLSELSELSEEVKQLMTGDNQIDTAYGLELVGDMVAISSATEVIVRSSSTEKQAAAFAEITDNVEEVQGEEILELLDSSTPIVEDFIEDQLAEIGKEISEGDLNDITTVRVTDYIEDAEMSLQTGDYTGVVNSVIDALTLIESKEYVNDFMSEVAE